MRPITAAIVGCAVAESDARDTGSPDPNALVMSALTDPPESLSLSDNIRVFLRSGAITRPFGAGDCTAFVMTCALIGGSPRYRSRRRRDRYGQHVRNDVRGACRHRSAGALCAQQGRVPPRIAPHS